VLVVGEGEKTNNTVNIRTRDNVVHGEHQLTELLAVLNQERDIRSLTCMFGVEKSAAGKVVWLCAALHDAHWSALYV
jgi:threonyl-tRNA synthetase